NQLATYWNHEINTKLTTDTMQNMALEMNFSESTFIEEPTSGEYAAKVRIFTPAREIPFAGHPTVGTAFVLKHQNLINKDVSDAILELGVGPIPVDYLPDGSIRMRQNEPEFMDIWGDKVSLASALNIEQEDIATSSPMQWVSTGFPFLIVPLKSLDAVKRASPNPSEILGSLDGPINKQVMIFSTETENEDSHVHSRMFAPEVGVVEDPATGSAAGPLTAYLEQYGILNREKRGEDIVIEQGYEIKRPSRIVGKVIGEDDFVGVYVSGLTRLVAEGTFYLDT
ncbi:MAG: PhzF family phenazine biosynthesis protein, partial [Candidatus Thorarchaeota archaeon]|nr:PhzF family phenazine biosynthesis protein [Candidatus Thorarchaeota archaeon]